MTSSVFVELRFWMLIVLSFFAPAAMYLSMHRRRAISPSTVFCLGVLLIGISGADVYLLQALETLARRTTSLVDDEIFASELSVALYIVPVCFAGLGINMVSHVFLAHLARAEARYAIEHEAAPVHRADDRVAKREKVEANDHG